jgi:hypothetical protein
LGSVLEAAVGYRCCKIREGLGEGSAGATAVGVVPAVLEFHKVDAWHELEKLAGWLVDIEFTS